MREEEEFCEWDDDNCMLMVQTDGSLLYIWWELYNFEGNWTITDYDELEINGMTMDEYGVYFCQINEYEED